VDLASAHRRLDVRLSATSDRRNERTGGRGYGARSPPTPRPLVHVGAFLMRTDAALALTGRRCIPRRLLDEGFAFEVPDFADAIERLTA
jgi:hypothetical protein